MSITVNGSVLSSLLFDHTNSEYDQEGFLLGKLEKHVTEKISDSQINNVNEEVITYIYNYLPCNRLFSWYDNYGKVVLEKLDALLKDVKHKDVIGWYKFRRNSSMTPSLRESAIHHYLHKQFCERISTCFVFCLFTTTITPSLSIHNFEHTFYCYRGRSLTAVPCSVVNLKDTSHAAYKEHTNLYMDVNKGQYNETLNYYHHDFVDVDGKLIQVTKVHTLNNTLLQQFKHLCTKVSASDDDLCQLSSEVTALQFSMQPAKASKPSVRQDILLDMPVPPVIDITEQTTPPLVRKTSTYPKQNGVTSHNSHHHKDLMDLFPNESGEIKTKHVKVNVENRDQSMLHPVAGDRFDDSMDHDSTCSDASSTRGSKKPKETVAKQLVTNLEDTRSHRGVAATPPHNDAFSFVSEIIQAKLPDQPADAPVYVTGRHTSRKHGTVSQSMDDRLIETGSLPTGKVRSSSITEGDMPHVTKQRNRRWGDKTGVTTTDKLKDASRHRSQSLIEGHRSKPSRKSNTFEELMDVSLSQSQEY